MNPEYEHNFVSFEEMFTELEKGNIEFFQYILDKDDMIWKKLELKWMLDYFIQIEDYEKCTVIKKAIDGDWFIANQQYQDVLNDIYIKFLDKFNDTPLE